MNTASQTVAAEILPHVDPELKAIREAEEARRDAGGGWDNGEALKAAKGAMVPRVGMGATWHGYSDSHACTIIEVRRNGKEIVVREDTATLLNGAGSDAPDALHFSPGGFCGHTSGTQRWAYTANPEGHVKRYSRRTQTYRGRTVVSWVLVGQKARGGERCTIGHRSHHYDFNF
jgi:hypothetical protein